MTNYYVAGNGNDSNSGLTRALAKRTINVAIALMSPGDVLYVGEGTYRPRWQWENVLLVDGKNNLTIEAIAGEARPKLTSVSASTGKGITGITALIKNSTYITVKGLLLEGCATTIDYNYAYANRANRTTDPSIIDNGLEINGGHHNTIRNVTVQDFSGMGMRALNTDYFTFDACEAYRNAFWTPWGCQGISVGSLVNSDTWNGQHNLIKNCISEENRSYIQWWTIEQNNPSWGITEGHGIIVDTQAAGYVGLTTIDNCQSRRNGGSGIQAFASNCQLVIKNCTVENNNKTTERKPDGSISLRNSSNIRVENNTVVNDPGVNAIGLDRVSQVTIYEDYVTGSYLTKT